MGKRNYGNGIFDLRYRADGTRSDYTGDLPFLACCHYGKQQYKRQFPTYKEALDWKEDQKEQHRNRDNIGYFKRKDLERLRELTVKDVIYRYIDYMSGRRNEDDPNGSIDVVRLHDFCGQGIAAIPLAEIKKHHFVKYFEQRQKETFTRKGWKVEKPRTARTVARERNLLQRAFQVSIEQNFFDICHLLENPVSDITIEGSKYSKTRTLRPGEEEKLIKAFEACQGRNRYYGPLAMYLSLDTAMRLQEIVRLVWSDIDFEHRRIKIRKTKTDKQQVAKGARRGKVIVLPVSAMSMFIELWHHLNDKGQLPLDIDAPKLKRPTDYPDSHIFIDRYGKRMSSGAMSDLFTDAVKRAGIEPYHDEALTFQCLRRAGNISFFGVLEPEERNIMRGSADYSMDGVYQDDEKEYILGPIRDKLDRHVLKVLKLDKDKQPVLDDEGNPIKVGATLGEWVKYHTGKNMTNLEILEAGEIPGFFFNRRTLTALRVLAKKADEEADQILSREKVLVFRCNKEGALLERLGFLTKSEAVSKTKVESYKLLDLDPGHKGILIEPDYLFISVIEVLKGMEQFGEDVKARTLVDYLHQQKRHSESSKVIELNPGLQR